MMHALCLCWFSRRESENLLIQPRYLSQNENILNQPDYSVSIVRENHIGEDTSEGSYLCESSHGVFPRNTSKPSMASLIQRTSNGTILDDSSMGSDRDDLDFLRENTNLEKINLFNQKLPVTTFSLLDSTAHKVPNIESLASG